MCGLAPSRVLGSLAYGAGGWEHASIRVLPTGKVEVVTGVSAHGQGHETAFSQIVADQLGVPFEDIEVLHGDTVSSARGLDTYGSRSLAVGGIAIVKAAEKVIAKARPIAAHLMEAAEDDLEFAAGKFSVRGTEKAVGLGDIAIAVFTAADLPDGIEPNLDSEATYDPENFSFPHGTHLCAVEVDTETGAVAIRKYVCVDDVGHVVNPMIVEGQVHGGLAQGIAQALYEDAVYDESGTMLSGSFAEYLVPGAPDLPTFVTDRTETPATGNPLGVKGVGESGTIASTPAVVNSVIDAVRHLGVRDIVMPCSPMRVWKAITAAPRQRHGTGRWAVIPSNFDYVAPTTLDEAVSALAAAGEDAKVLGGGQSLMPVLRLRMAAPTTVVDLGRIAELRGVREDGDAIVIGAMTTHHDVAHDETVRRHAALLSEASATVADPQIRHRGTFGGGIAHADPAGDLCAPAVALDATMVCVGPNGRREVAAADFFTDYFTTALEPDEILAEVRIPKHTGWVAHYEKFHRVEQSWSMVAVAATLEVEGDTIRARRRADQHGGGPGACEGSGGGARRAGRDGRSDPRRRRPCGGGHRPDGRR